MLSLYLFIGILYAVLLITISNKATFLFTSFVNPSFQPSVSIIVPFRNEEKNLPTIFQCFHQQDYSAFEVIWVDDHSTDQSCFILQRLIASVSNPNMRIISNMGEGKKKAIESAVKVSISELIFTIDADCWLPRDFLKIRTVPFIDPKIQLVAGPVMIRQNHSFYNSFQLADWGSILLMTNYFFKSKRPMMCSGANLSYRRKSFFKVNGYEGNEHVLSGDDEFLLKKIVKKYGSKNVDYLASPFATVWTLPHKKLSTFVAQRIRWASKWRQHNSWTHLIFSAVPFVTQLFFLSTFFLWNSSVYSVILLVMVWVIKWSAEMFVLNKVLRIYHNKISIMHWLGISLIHPLYVIGIGIGAIPGKYSWKGRNQE